MANQVVAKGQGGATITIASGDGWASSASSCVIIVFIVRSSVTLVNDSASNTYTSLFSISNLTCWATVTSVSITSITCTGTGAPTMIAIEDDSIITAGYSDGNNTKSASTTGTWDSGSVTTTNAADVAYAAAYFGNATTTIAANAPFTALSGTGLTSGYIQNAGASRTLFACSNTYNVTGTYNATGTDSAGPATYNAGIAFFKQPLGPPPYGPLIYTRTQFFVTDTVLMN